MKNQKATMSTRTFKSVHDSHCCKKHGCKYGDNNCPVVYGDEQGIYCECCESDEHDPAIQLQKKLVTALHEAYAALRRGRPQIFGILVQQDFDSAIASAKEALEAAEGKIHETNTGNPIDFPGSK